jgi:hypothetical protein
VYVNSHLHINSAICITNIFLVQRPYCSKTPSLPKLVLYLPGMRQERRLNSVLWRPCGFSFWNLLQITCPSPRTLNWLPDFWGEICANSHTIFTENAYIKVKRRVQCPSTITRTSRQNWKSTSVLQTYRRTNLVILMFRWPCILVWVQL